MTTLHATAAASTATVGMRPPTSATTSPTFNAGQRRLIDDFAKKYGISDGKGFAQSLAHLGQSQSPSNAPSFLHGPRHGGEGGALREIGRHVEQAIHRMFHPDAGQGHGKGHGHVDHTPGHGKGHGHRHAHRPSDTHAGHDGGKLPRPPTGTPTQSSTEPVAADPTTTQPVNLQPIRSGPVVLPTPTTPSRDGLPAKALEMLKDLGTLMKSLGLLDRAVQTGLSELRSALEKAAGSAAMPDSVQGVQAA